MCDDIKNSKYIDPPNKEIVLQKLFSLQEDKDGFRKYVDELFPGWLLYSLEKYSTDYAFLQSNWHRICQIRGSNPKRIVLVDEIIFDRDSHMVLNVVCDILTNKGYVVRTYKDFIPCKKCHAVIPNIHVWKHMKDNKCPVPDDWLEMCQKCEMYINTSFE